MIKAILDYQIMEELYASANSLVYRGRRQVDDQPVVLKMLKQAYPSPEKIAWFKREYEITRDLDVTGVVQAYSLESDQNRWLMVLEDFGGSSLDHLNLAGRLTVPDFLELTIKVTAILGQIHQQHIMHKDINPSNIVLNPATGQVKIIDFGISTVLSQETLTFRNPNVMEGTLAYISPEQTGRMNRAMDYRTDFYSLGVTFYELLTGQLPFPTADTLELVHNHIAGQPQPPHRLDPTIPQLLSEIIQRLMSKNAKDRYQSAHGLKVDLEECLRQWQSKGQIDHFPLGIADVSDRFQISQRLYGREQEIETLLSTTQRVSQGVSEMLLVAGYAGIGKTALVQEVYKPITEQHGYFISGKFDQLQRDIPYASIIQAFRSLMRQLLTESETKIVVWREKLLAALGPNGQIVIEVIPEVELILGPQPNVPELGPVESLNRFNLVFENFIRVFTQPEHPLVIFLDDLQWADSASLKLLELLMTAPDSHHLFLIGAYRDNEVSDIHPLMLTLAEIEKTEGATVNHLLLSPLALPDVVQFVADTLHCESARAEPLAELVLTKTDGNPFFIGEFLKSLYAERLLTFDHQRGKWQWNLGQIQGQEITDNVVDLLVVKVQQLPEATQQALKLAACIGNQFDLDTLDIVSDQSPRETAVDLWPGIVAGLVLPLSDAYKLVELDVPGLANEITAEYKFAHDRIQQAVYSLIPDTDKQAVHWQVGQLLLESISDDQEQNIFDVVNQLNLGRALADKPDLTELARLNLLAGRKAKASTAYQSTFNYLQVGLGLLEENDWQNQYDLTLALYAECAEAAFLNTDFDEMERLAKIVLPQSKTLLDKVLVYEVRVQACTAQKRFSESIKAGLEFLRLLGLTFPDQPDMEDIMGALGETQSVLTGKQTEDLIDLPKMTDPVKLAAMRILTKLWTPIMQARTELIPLLVSKQVNLSVEHGNSADSAYAYAMYGVILCGGGDIDAGYQFGQLALQILERFDAKELVARTFVIIYAFLIHWKEPFRDIIPFFRDAYQAGLESGDLELSANGALTYCVVSYFAGKPLAGIEQEMAKYRDAISHSDVYQSGHEMYWQVVLNLLGRNENPCQIIGKVYDEEIRGPRRDETENKGAVFILYFNKVILSYLFHEFQQSLDYLDTVEENFAQLAATFYAPLYYFYDSLTRLAVFSGASKSEQEDTLERVNANQEKMKIGAGHAPSNCLHKFHLVQAERSRVLEEHKQAREHYDKAIDLAHEHQYLNEEALAYELAARFYLDQGQTRLALYYLRDAHYAYRRWGAVAKVADLEKRYPQLLAQLRPKSGDITTTTSTTSDRIASDVLDFGSVLKASQAISGEIVLDKLLATLIKVVIENAGAERGCLLLNKNGQWVIEAEGALDKQDVTVLQSIPVQENLVPVSIINYVARTQENVVLDDARREEFKQDSYILARQPRSVLCSPLINQGRLNGILYLENNLTTGAFTPARLRVLNLLSSQAAISIENASLYDTLEHKVQERTLELEQEIVVRKRAEEAAKAANRAKSTFLANMSHELRSPLNAILGFSQLTARQELSPDQRANLGIIRRSGEHLLTLINQVLDLAKIEAGRSTLDETEFDLYRLLDDLQDMFGLTAEDKHLQLIFDRGANVPRYVRADEVKLRQILINLLNNALKFTEEGSVTLKVECGEIKTEKLAEQSDCSFSILFSIVDTGPGIAPDEMEHLFEAFVQTETGRRVQEGTGLGLPISRQFIQLMGGNINVNSKVGYGATFAFDVVVGVVDASAVESKARGRRVIALEPDQPRYRILVVDDRWENRQLLLKLLAPLGFELQEASNGQEAIEIWETWHPHLIWMDIRMPVMDGYQAIEHIRSQAGTKAPAIIALTASVWEDEQAAVLATECDGFLRKPFRATDIFDLMHQHIGVRYVYDKAPLPPVPAETRTLTPSDLSILPPELLARLEQATDASDMKMIDDVIVEIRTRDAALADAFVSLAYNFEYDEILNLIRAVESKK